MTLVDTSKIGRKGGQKRAENLSDKERSESASNAVKARWAKYYAEHPEKKKAALAKKKKAERVSSKSR